MIAIVITHHDKYTVVDTRRIRRGLLFLLPTENVSLGSSSFPIGHDPGFAYHMALHTAEMAAERGERPIKVFFKKGN